MDKINQIINKICLSNQQLVTLIWRKSLLNWKKKINILKTKIIHLGKKLSK